MGRKSRVSNVADGGFCLCIPQTDSTGEPLLMEIENGQDAAIKIPARVRWRKELDRGVVTGTQYLSLGCTFMDNGSFRLLKERFLQTAGTQLTPGPAETRAGSRQLPESIQPAPRLPFASVASSI